VEASTSANFSIYVIVILTADGRYKRPKHVVEDKWMLSVWGVVLVLIVKTDVDLKAQRYNHNKESINLFICT
jgi:hypothetical protein